jgi:hypothetical protein
MSDFLLESASPRVSGASLLIPYNESMTVSELVETKLSHSQKTEPSCLSLNTQAISIARCPCAAPAEAFGKAKLP